MLQQIVEGQLQRTSLDVYGFLFYQNPRGVKTRQDQMLLGPKGVKI